MMKWFDIIILATQFGFEYRASLWYTVSQSKYISATAFGKTIMHKHHLNMLCRHARWSHQIDV